MRQQDVAGFSVVFTPSVVDEEDAGRLRDGYPWGETQRAGSAGDTSWARWWWAATAFCLVALVLVVVTVVVRQVDAAVPEAPASPGMSEQRDAAKTKVDRRSPVDRGDAKDSGR